MAFSTRIARPGRLGRILVSATFLSLAFAMTAHATTIPSNGGGDAADPRVLFATGFELSGFGGATRHTFGDTLPEKIETKGLDGLAMELEPNQYLRWSIGITPFPNRPTLHYMAFDYFADELGGVLTHFLDSPRIKRTDITVELGRHRVEIFHDIENLTSLVLINGAPSPRVRQFLAPDEGANPRFSTWNRIGSYTSGPAGSRGAFLVDNFVWKVGVEAPAQSSPVPEPGTALLVGLGLIVLARRTPRTT